VVTERYAALRAVMGSLDRSAVMAGGAIGELVYRVIDLAQACLRAPVADMRNLTHLTDQSHRT